MQKQFLKYIEKIGVNTEAKILVAVSGGLDSMALLHLFHLSGFSIEVAHCNFNLRGTESDADEQFVKAVCIDLGVRVYNKRFETEKYAKENGVSIQMAARDLRYAWFEELRAEKNFDYIATAHHQDDQVETLLLNLTRGTGLKGMHGILPKHGVLIRPLLFTNRESLEAWMESKSYKYREDSSNASVKYARNKLRHKVLPTLKEINPSASNTFQENAERFSAVEKNVSFLYEKERSKLFVHKDEESHLILDELLKYPSAIDVIFHFISEFDFNDWRAIENLLGAESGKRITSSSHVLLKDRNLLILKKKEEKLEQEYEILEECIQIFNPFSAKIQVVQKEEFTLSKDIEIAALDFNRLVFPLTLRKWRKGDVFYPLGMKGKKKLSDFFIDTKMSVFEKENTWILCSGEDIVWVVGQRIDERFKLVEQTQKVYLVTLNK